MGLRARLGMVWAHPYHAHDYSRSSEPRIPLAHTALRAHHHQSSKKQEE